MSIEGWGEVIIDVIAQQVVQARLTAHGSAYIKSASLTVASLAVLMTIVSAKSTLPLCSDQ